MFSISQLVGGVENSLRAIDDIDEDVADPVDEV